MKRHAPSIGIGLGLSLRNYGSVSLGLLDLYPATAAYSAYDLGNKRGSVTEAEGTVVNPVQRWRRGSDDALQMFTANDIASGTALTWAGTTAYLLTEYDQSGNGYEYTQTTAANQPLVVSGGVLLRDSRGNVAPDFDGVNDSLHSSLVPPSSCTLIGVAEFDVVGATRMIVGARDDSNKRSYIASTSSSVISIGVGLGVVGTSTPVVGETYLVTGSYSGTAANCSVDGVNESGTSAAPVNTTHGYSLGALNDAGTDSAFMDGHIAAVLVYNTDQSANRAAIEAKLSTIVTTALS